MIDYMNEYHQSDYIFKYSTPSIYIDALKEKDVKWPTKYDDLFPYSDDPDSYWTGYFTSRANDKQLIRKTSSEFHASARLYAEKMFDENLGKTNLTLSDMKNSTYEMLDQLGINQHHDAVTGTANQATADDYARRLSLASEKNSGTYS